MVTNRQPTFSDTSTLRIIQSSSYFNYLLLTKYDLGGITHELRMYKYIYIHIHTYTYARTAYVCEVEEIEDVLIVQLFLLLIIMLSVC